MDQYKKYKKNQIDILHLQNSIGRIQGVDRGGISATQSGCSPTNVRSGGKTLPSKHLRHQVSVQF